MKFATFWITGQPGSGKTTIGKGLAEYLRGRGLTVVHLDGDQWRALSGNVDFSPEGRRRNVLAAQMMSVLLNDSGVFVVASFVSPIRQIREAFKASHSVTELYTHTTEIRGREKFFAENYEPPLSGFIDVDTTGKSVSATMQGLVEFLGLNNIGNSPKPVVV